MTALAIARAVALGKATALVAAVVAGAAAALVVTLLPSSGQANTAGHDLRVGYLLLAVTAVLLVAGLVLERAGIDPRPRPPLTPGDRARLPGNAGVAEPVPSCCPTLPICRAPLRPGRRGGWRAPRLSRSRSRSARSRSVPGGVRHQPEAAAARRAARAVGGPDRRLPVRRRPRRPSRAELAAELAEARARAAELHEAQLAVVAQQQEQLEAARQAYFSQEIELRQFGELQLARDAAARRESEQELELSLRREVERVLADQLASLREEVAALRAEVVDKLGGQLRLERIETTRVIGSDLEALQHEIRRLAAVRQDSLAATRGSVLPGPPEPERVGRVVEAEPLSRVVQAEPVDRAAAEPQRPARVFDAGPERPAFVPAAASQPAGRVPDAELVEFPPPATELPVTPASAGPVPAVRAVGRAEPADPFASLPRLSPAAGRSRPDSRSAAGRPRLLRATPGAGRRAPEPEDDGRAATRAGVAPVERTRTGSPASTAEPDRPVPVQRQDRLAVAGEPPACGGLVQRCFAVGAGADLVGHRPDGGVDVDRRLVGQQVHQVGQFGQLRPASSPGSGTAAGHPRWPRSSARPAGPARWSPATAGPGRCCASRPGRRLGPPWPGDRSQPQNLTDCTTIGMPARRPASNRDGRDCPDEGLARLAY